MFGLDVGGTLAKVVYLDPSKKNSDPNSPNNNKVHQFITSSKSYGQTGHRDEACQLTDAALGQLHFIRFETRRVGAFIDIIREQLDNRPLVAATGGGAVKFQVDFRQFFDLCIYDELECVIEGINYFLASGHDEFFVLPAPLHSEREAVSRESNLPFLVVNVGSGVSILKVDGDTTLRIGGTSLGGGTFFGLCSLLTQCKDFDEALALAEKGDSTNVDMLVKDIYGGDYCTKDFVLDGNLIASSFGKMVRPENRVSPAREDMARALLQMVTSNIGSLARLHSQVQNVSTIFFVGSFLSGNFLSQQLLSKALHFWSGGTQRAVFLEHTAYLGAVGALFRSMKAGNHNSS